jgi:hypothetical protein
MAIARTALETIANADPGVLKLARETLDKFSVLFGNEQFKEFFLGVQQDQPIPEVDPTDLRRFHENMSEQSGRAAIGLSTIAPSTLSVMFVQGFLADLQQGTEPDGSVYRVAATIPLNGVQFDSEAFVTRLSAENGA